jgi:TRAP-type C4-dicarboxylate transport system substrate-binding protein
VKDIDVRRLVIWFALACALSWAGAAASQASRTIELNEPAPPGGPEDLALRHFKQGVEAATHGRISIDVHLGAAEGGAETSVESMMFGELNMLSGNLTDYLPLMIDEMSGLATPFLIPGVGPARAYLASPLLDEAREKVLHSRRIRFLEMSAIRQPFDVIASRRPIGGAEALKGLRMTSITPMTKSAARLWQALGVVYVPPMSAAEMKTALGAGRLDAVIVPDVAIISRDGLGRLAPYLTGVDDCPKVWEISINEPLWGQLSAPDQAALRSVAEESAAIYEREARVATRDELHRLAGGGGGHFVQLEAQAIRLHLAATYRTLAGVGGLSPRVLETADSAAAAPN